MRWTNSCVIVNSGLVSHVCQMFLSEALEAYVRSCQTYTASWENCERF